MESQIPYKPPPIPEHPSQIVSRGLLNFDPKASLFPPHNNDITAYHSLIVGQLDKLKTRASITPSVDSHERLTWNDYISLLPSDYRYDQALKSKFVRLQTIVKSWVGSDSSSSFLSSAMHIIYHALGPLVRLQDGDKNRSHLEQLLGQVTPSIYREAYDVASYLYNFHQNALRGETDLAVMGNPPEDIDDHAASSIDLSSSNKAAQIGTLQRLAQAAIDSLQKNRQRGSGADSSSKGDASSLTRVQELELGLFISSAVTSPTSTMTSSSAGYGSRVPVLSPFDTISPHDHGLPFKVTMNLHATRASDAIDSHALFTLIPSDDAVESGDNRTEISSNQSSKQSSSASSSSVFTYAWLFTKCETYVTYNDDGTAAMPASILTQSVLSTLKSSHSDERIQSDLLDLLGFDAFEFIFELITNRAVLSKVTPTTDTSASKTTAKNQNDATSTTQKSYRQLLKKFHSMSTNKNNPQFAAKQPSTKNKGKTRSKADFEKQDALIASLKQYKTSVTLDDLHKSESALILPKDDRTKRIRHEKYEEVIILPPPTEPLPMDQRIEISKGFDSTVAPIFGSITHLNTLQSKVYQCAYKSNGNMLVCAPTGAGKTNVALMTIANEIMNNVIDDTFIDKSAFKIVYVAPMKALAAEVTSKFRQALTPLGLLVRELTGDMQMTKREIQETQVIVTTPEKWDVITRKSNDGTLMQMVKLLIIDEIHLLHEDRGPVLETLVARTHRQIESSQQLCRIVGLSATLPNYRDVAQFLAVSDDNLFYFDQKYRPVPLEQHFIGVPQTNPLLRLQTMNEIAYSIALKSIKELNQVMIFVNSRNDTRKTAQWILNYAREYDDTAWFNCEEVPGFRENLLALRKLGRSSELEELARFGVGIHHAGMNRAERAWMENSFMKGYLAILVSTATLAWGVNLPAHTVILKGTQLYDPKRGGFVDVGMLDVMQIFGRAGRPQFDTSGEAFLITSHDKLAHYLQLLTSQLPIESQMIKSLPDHLNAEIILGTVTNLREADTWLTYTYLYTRMLRNPTSYGVSLKELDNDPTLTLKRRQLITEAAKQLMKCRMVKFDIVSGNFYSTDIGRVASLYYLHHMSVETYNTMLKSYMTDEQIIDLISHSREFEQLRCRDEEMHDLERLVETVCLYKPLSGIETSMGKANVLLQCYISQVIPPSSTLQSDQYFMQQSAGRIARALFEMVLRRGKAMLAAKLLEFCKIIQLQMWPFQHPLRQFKNIKLPTIRELESRRLFLDDLIDMSPKDISQVILCSPAVSQSISRAVQQIPWLHITPIVQPLTRDVLRIELQIECQHQWNPAVHGDSELWWLWVEDTENENIYHHESWSCTRQMAREVQSVTFTIPISEPLPTQYILRAINDRWMGSDISVPISFHDVLLPEHHPPHTDLLPMQPIPTRLLFNPRAQELFGRFTHFNPVQTQAFHTLYHTDHNVLLGAPTGSGKTVVAELAILRLLNTAPGKKIIYIAPMKALVRERYEDWSSKSSFAGIFGCSVLELTGDNNPEMYELKRADILITTPEKWDGLSRSWHTREYVKDAALIIIDEIHLLGQDRGPILEVIVSRMRYITSQQQQQHQLKLAKYNEMGLSKDDQRYKRLMEEPKQVRIVGLSTALSNARDIGEWLNIPPQGLFNFHPVVRPVPLTTYIAGFPGKHYCPRMATMNKPCYAAITTHSPHKPVIIFVSSRRQTRLTALDLITLTAADGNSKRFLRISDEEIEVVLDQVEDNVLRHCLSFGIGLHHAGLPIGDRDIVERLFVSQKIQILICTSTLAWGVNFPAHLVIVKGTEFYDTKTFRYTDYSITDVLQMLGRSGRPQFDSEGKAVVLVQESKKSFFQKFLHSPFPVESSLHKYLHNHLNAEIAQGSVTTLSEAVEWLSWTFFFRRLLMNPTYYGLASAEDPVVVNEFLLSLIGRTLADLEKSACITVDLHTKTISTTSLGQIAAYYYLDYRTIAHFFNHMSRTNTLSQLLDILCASREYWELPVRHNEDLLNREMMKDLYWSLDESLCGNPHTKTNILFQARWLQLPLPISDYETDTKSALAQSARIIQSMIEVASDSQWLHTTMQVILLNQMFVQGHFPWTSPFINLPYMTSDIISLLRQKKIQHLPQLMALSYSQLEQIVGSSLPQKELNALHQCLTYLPIIDLFIEPPDDWVRTGVVRNRSNPGGDSDLLEHSGGARNDKGNSEDSQENSKQKKKSRSRKGKASQSVTPHNTPSPTLCIPSGTHLSLKLGLQRVNPWCRVDRSAGPIERLLGHKEPQKVIGPNDVKTVREGWFVLIADSEMDQILCLRHVSIGVKRQAITLQVNIPDDFPLDTEVPLTVYLFSDCYIGLDQQYEFNLVVEDLDL